MRTFETFVGLLVVIAVLVLACFGIVALGEAFVFYDAREFQATVVSKQYKHAETHVHTGFTSNGRGGTSPVITTSHEPEHWTLIVSTDGSAFAVDTNSVRWTQATEGQSVSVTECVGKLTGNSYWRKLK